MKTAICWGGPLHGKTHAIFRYNSFHVPQQEADGAKCDRCGQPVECHDISGFYNPRTGVGGDCRVMIHAPIERYTLVRMTYNDHPTLTQYTFPVWLAESFDKATLDGKPIVDLCAQQNLPVTRTAVPADSPIWKPKDAIPQKTE